MNCVLLTDVKSACVEILSCNNVGSYTCLGSVGGNSFQIKKKEL